MSTTIAALEAAWLAVWESSTILSLTDKIHTYQITQDSAKELEDLMFEGADGSGEVNFIEALSSRTVTHGETGRKNYTYKVQVNYYRKKDTEGNSWKEVRDFFDTLYTAVTTELSTTWDATVDFFEPQEDAAEISEFTIDKEPVWRGTYTYTGFKIA